MRITRKIIPVGDSKGITLPSIWLQSLKEKTGVDATHVFLDIEDESITVLPAAAVKVLPKPKEKT